MRYLLLSLLTLFSITDSYAIKRKHSSQTVIETNHHMISSRDLGFLSLNDLIERPNTIYLNEDGVKLSFEAIEEFLSYKLNKKWSAIKNHLAQPVRDENFLSQQAEWYLLFQTALFLTSRDSASNRWFQKRFQGHRSPKRVRLEPEEGQKLTMTPPSMYAENIARDILKKYKNAPPLKGSLNDIQLLISANLQLFGQTPQTFSSQFFIQPLTGKVQTEGNTFDSSPHTVTLLKLACAINLIQKRGFEVKEQPRPSYKHAQDDQQRPSSEHSSTSDSSMGNQITPEILPLTKVASCPQAYQDILNRLKGEMLRHKSAFLKTRNDERIKNDRSRHFCLFFAAYFLAAPPQRNSNLTKEHYDQLLLNQGLMPDTLDALVSLGSFCAHDIVQFYGMPSTELLNNVFYNRSSKSWIIPYRANLPANNENWPIFLAHIVSRLNLLGYFNTEEEDDDIVVLEVKTSSAHSRGL